MKLYLLTASLLLAWHPVTQPLGVTVANYRVWRGVNGAKLTDFHNGVVGTSYKDLSVVRRKTYCYAVQSVSTQGETSALSAQVCKVAN